MLRKFIDKECAGNLTSGLEYYAAGLVVADHRNPDESGSHSGKDYAVEFIDPWGNYQHEWRAVDEVIVSEIEQADFEYLKLCYELHSKS
jgi:hypothetical protein